MVYGIWCIHVICAKNMKYIRSGKYVVYVKCIYIYMWYTVKNIYEHTISIVKKKKTCSVYSGIAISVSKKNMYATKNRYEL